jgi:hypothetical protein
MSRLFELKSHTYQGDVDTIVDLDKVCWLQIEKKPGEHYPHLTVRFVDGHDWHDLMIDQSAFQLVEAYRAHLAGKEPHLLKKVTSEPQTNRPTNPSAEIQRVPQVTTPTPISPIHP